MNAGSLSFNKINSNKKINPHLLSIRTQMGLFLYKLFVDRRIIELTAAVPADAAVVPRNYVVGFAIGTAFHYAALHW